MTCFVPSSSRNLDIGFFAFRPMVVLVDEFLDALNQFSECTETLGCIHNAIFRSIHGNTIIWYGAWIKRSKENKEQLNETLQSMLKNTRVSNMAVLVDQSFFDACAGESRDGSPIGRFSTGDIISINTFLFKGNVDMNETSYAWIAIFKSRYAKMEGAISGVCLKSQNQPILLNLFVWRSLQMCYSCILTRDYKKTTLVPFLENLIPVAVVKYDVFRVVYVIGDNYMSKS